MRRSRRTAALRRLVVETGLSASDLIYPVFVLDGEDRSEQVESMPGVERQTVDRLLTTLGEAVKLGIPAVALFPSKPSRRPIPTLPSLPTLRWTPTLRTGRTGSSTRPDT
jgi:porphobilinogen synthase